MVVNALAHVILARVTRTPGAIIPERRLSFPILPRSNLQWDRITSRPMSIAPISLGTYEIPGAQKSKCSEAALSKKIDAHDGIRRPITHCPVRST
jgi:hypothetical protein